MTKKRKPRPSPWAGEPPRQEVDPDLRIIGNRPDLAAMFPEKEKDKKVFRSFWSSPEHFATVIESKSSRDAWHDSGWERSEGRSGFSGSESMEATLDLVRSGWKEGAEQASRLLGKIQATYPFMKKPIDYKPVGVLPSVPRAVAGNPNNMRMPDATRSKKRPIITLLSDMAANCNHESEEFINRAAVVAAVIDEIEARGYACDVIAYAGTRANWGSNDTRTTAETSVLVKDSNQPVDIARLAFGLGHTSIFRRMIFAEWGSDNFCKGLGRGLGSSHIPPVRHLNEQNIFVLPSVEHAMGCFKEEELAETEGLRYIITALQAQRFPPLKDVEINIPYVEAWREKFYNVEWKDSRINDLGAEALGLSST